MLRGPLYSLRMVSQLRIIGFHPTRNINQDSGEDWRSLWLQNVRLSLALSLIMLMDVEHIHPPVSLASSCYQGILKIDLDMISYSSFHLCLRDSSRAALGNRIQGLSCGEVIVSHLRITASLDVYDSGNVTERPCWRCWRLAV